MIADTFDACGLFEIAEQVERNGAKFCRRASEIFHDKGICEALLRLGDWEAEHERVFVGMREQLSSLTRRSVVAKSQQIAIAPGAMAGLAVFGIRSDPRDEFDGAECRDDIVKRAMEKGRASIVFYEGLKDFAADPVGRDEIDDIIREEMKHVVILNKLLE